MEYFSAQFFVLVGTACALAVSVAINLWQYSQRFPAVRANGQSGRIWSLPDGWWSDTTRFQTEQRAIFSQTWMCVSHRGRFQKVGDYIVYEVAGFHFFMILGKDMVVRSFHNVCRHRAFPVARKQSGTATVLGCRYHGWSYDTTGTLVKAPYFDNLPGFDKSQNSLFKIHTKQDSNGFLHINVSTEDGAGLTNPPKATQVGKLGKISLDSELLGTIMFNGQFNWKVILNKRTTPSSTGISSTGVRRTFSTKGPTPVGELNLFPLATVHTMAGRPFWYQLIYSPDAPEQTSIRCDVYANTTGGTFKFEGATKEALEKDLREKISELESEHKALVASGRNMSCNGEQINISNAVETHLRKETIRGLEIKPAAAKSSFQNEALSKADKICEAVACGASGRLEW